MSSDEFIAYLRNPGRLDEESLPLFRELSSKYPFSSSVQLLYALNLHRENDPDFLSGLKTAAAYAASRTRLKQLFWEYDPSVRQVPEEKTVPVPVPEPEPSPVLNVPDVVTEKEEEAVKSPEIVEMNETAREALLAIVKKRLEEIRAEKRAGKKKTELSSTESPAGTQSMTKEEIIERFIREEPRISAPRAEFYNPSESASRSNLDDEGIVSETLALLCIDQGEKQRAIRIYERLSLLFPEKSVYFAAQIQKLRS